MDGETEHDFGIPKKLTGSGDVAVKWLHRRIMD
jgi:hypothetical protein